MNATVLVAELDAFRLDAFLAQKLTGYSRQFLKKLIASGAVTVDGKPSEVDARVRAGSRIEVTWPASPDVSSKEFENWVVFEDKRILVLNKPSGLLMHPLGDSWLTTPDAARSEPVANLAGLLQTHRPEILRAKTPRCGIVHRLDRPTSGVLIVAKDPASWEKMIEAFKARAVEKTYRAIVRGVPKKSARVSAPIGRPPGKRRVVVTSLGKTAETDFKIIGRRAAAALVEAKPRTGRTHQIRAHLAFLGYPVAGDPDFDLEPGKFAAPRLMLHARRIVFLHPATGRRAEFATEPPKDFIAFWKSLP